MAGNKFELNRSHSFDPSKKITKVEVMICLYEKWLYQINFYHQQQRLVSVGSSDDDAKDYIIRREVFEIADDEQLVGCELDHGKHFNKNNVIYGVTWIKMKVNV
jgi:hypothetical protein